MPTSEDDSSRESLRPVSDASAGAVWCGSTSGSANGLAVLRRAARWRGGRREPGVVPVSAAGWASLSAGVLSEALPRAALRALGALSSDSGAPTGPGASADPGASAGPGVRADSSAVAAVSPCSSVGGRGAAAAARVARFRGVLVRAGFGAGGTSAGASPSGAGGDVSVEGGPFVSVGGVSFEPVGVVSSWASIGRPSRAHAAPPTPGRVPASPRDVAHRRAPRCRETRRKSCRYVRVGSR